MSISRSRLDDRLLTPKRVIEGRALDIATPKTVGYTLTCTQETVLLNTASIIQDIDKEITRLQQLRQLLADTFLRRGPGRPQKASATTPRKPRKGMSAEGRAKIAAAQRARWAKARKDEKAKPKK